MQAGGCTEGDAFMKRAAIVGIDDYPGTANDLGGCVNDAEAWKEVLTGMLGFDRGEVRLLLNREATRSAILGALDDLIAGAGAGDVAAFIFSGHGTWVPDTGLKDEPDKRDEALVPCEADFKRLIIDDDIRLRLDRIPPGVSFTFISDSCHSGTVTRLLPDRRVGDRARFFPPPASLMDRMRDQRAPLSRLRGLTEEGMAEVFMSASSPDEPAAEDEFDGVRRGVFSYFAVRKLMEAGPGTTYEQWMDRIRDAIASAGFSQSPQLEGPAHLKRLRVFSPLSG